MVMGDIFGTDTFCPLRISCIACTDLMCVIEHRAGVLKCLKVVFDIHKGISIWF